MKEEQIFQDAIEQPADQRTAFLLDACGDDVALRERVEVLLGAHANPGSFLGSPASELAATTDACSITEQPGTIIGPYKLLQQVGEGGMGVVFMAEQTEPLQRTVALKIIKPGMDSRQVIARFEAERQALAIMDHPNIARVIDAGTTETGRLYFVMELVKGVPITNYCDEKQLSLRQRLGLFMPVCEAVQHAHQKGIIHRDIKPTNVLVAEYDNHAVPKIIDFGVAKATAQKLTQQTMFTEFGQVIGTVEYMSPEQAKFNQLDIDTRSDVYSLGVLLYELLTGSTPFERERLREAALDEVLRIIREEEPPKPSTRLSTSRTLPSVAAQRQTEPARLSKDVHGDLDWIVMKCLEKDRNRRYETANAVARDLERSLRDEPIEACPPSFAYRLRKLAKRNKRALATAALFGVLLLSALAAVAGSIGWAARDRAARQSAVEREVSLALQEVQSAYEKDAHPDAMAAVKKAEAVLASGAPQPHLQRRVERWKTDLRLVERLEEIRLDKGKEPFSLGTVGAYFNALQDYGLKQLPQLLVIDMYDLADAGRSPLKPRQLKKVDVSESADVIRGSPIKPHLVAALDDWAALASDHDRRVLFAIAREVDDNPWRNRLRDAIQQDDVESLRSLAMEEDWATQPPTSIAIFAGQLFSLNEPELNELGGNVLRRAQQRHPDDFWINLYLAQFLWNQSSHQDDAVGFARAAVACRPDSPDVRIALGSVLESLGQFADAEAEFREALRLKPDHVNAYSKLGGVCLVQRKWSEAISVYEKAIQNLPAVHQGWLHVHLAEMLIDIPSEELRNPRRAVELAREAIQLAPKNWTATDALGMALYRTGDWQASVDALERSFALTPGPKGSHSIDATRWLYLGMAHWQMGHKDEARAWYDKAVAWMDKHEGYRYRELVRLRGEAADLLGLPESGTDESPTSSKSPPPTADDQ